MKSTVRIVSHGVGDRGSLQGRINQHIEELVTEGWTLRDVNLTIPQQQCSSHEPTITAQFYVVPESRVWAVLIFDKKEG